MTVEDSLLLSTGRASGYIGQLQFAKEETLRAIRASGRGKLFLSTPSQVISVLHLDQAAVCVERSRFLACQGTLAITPGQVEQPDGTGGLEYFTIAGTGYLAVATGKETILETISQHLPMTVHARAISLWTGRLAMAPPEEDLSEILGGGGAEIISVQGEGTLVIEKPFLHNN